MPHPADPCLAAPHAGGRHSSSQTWRSGLRHADQSASRWQRQSASHRWGCRAKPIFSSIRSADHVSCAHHQAARLGTRNSDSPLGPAGDRAGVPAPDGQCCRSGHARRPKIKILPPLMVKRSPSDESPTARPARTSLRSRARHALQSGTWCASHSPAGDFDDR